MARITKAEARAVTLNRESARRGKYAVRVVDFDQLARDLQTRPAVSAR